MSAGVNPRPNGKWIARYYGPDHKERSKTFEKKRDAVAWRSEQIAEMRRGHWIDPRGGELLFSEFATKWLETKRHLKPSSYASYVEILNSRVLPKWESWSVGAITVGEASSWKTALTREELSPSRINKCLLVLNQVLDLAVSRGKLGQNILRVPEMKRLRERKSKAAAFTAEEVFQLAAYMPEHYRLATIFACFTGLRMSELIAVQVGDVDLKRQVVHIERASVLVDNVVHTGLPKTHEVRDVPLIDLLVKELPAHIAGKGKGSWLFPGPDGEQMEADKYRSAFMTRVAKLGRPTMTPNNCRDTAASLAISLGKASVKTVSVMLGHADAAITLQRYTAFFPNDYDTLRNSLSGAADAAFKSSKKSVAEILKNKKADEED